MTPQEFRAAREQLGLSKAALARILGVSSGRTVAMWEHGERPVTGPVALAMRQQIRIKRLEDLLRRACDQLVVSVGKGLALAEHIVEQHPELGPLIAEAKEERRAINP